MAIRLVLFDMDDVLCDYAVERRIARLAALAGCTPDEVRARLWDSGFLDEADRGAFDAPGTLKAFGERLGFALTRAQWVSARREAMSPFTDVLDLVAGLRGQADLAILTNNDPLVGETIAELFPALPALFGPRILVSATLGVAKPDPECFRRACARLGHEAHETFFVDDRAENVEGARTAGLSGHVFRGAAELAVALRVAGLTVPRLTD